MAIYELWIETTMDQKYIGSFERIPPEKNNKTFNTPLQDTPMAAAQALRAQVRKLLGADDQFRIRNRINIYDNINDALEDMLRH